MIAQKLGEFFVCVNDEEAGSSVSKQCSSHWIVHTISKVNAFWAALKWIAPSQICAAATWSAPCTDVIAPPCCSQLLPEDVTEWRPR